MQEIWKDVTNYEGYYQISNLGKIRSLDRHINYKDGSVKFKKGKVLKQSTDKDGYKGIILYKLGTEKGFRIHRLVCETFIGLDPERTIVNHKNAIKNDNRIENLEWCTHQENIDHSIENSLQDFCKGEQVGSSKLTKEDVLYIRANYKKGNGRKLALKFNVQRPCISKIIDRTTWKHI